MVRTPTVDKNGIRRGAWSEEEDNILKSFVLKHGHPNWRQLPRFAGLSRCGKSCRLRWKNYLNPKIKRGNFTDEEVEKIIKLHQEFRNKWSLIALKLPGRTDNEIKNYWHTHHKKHAENRENMDLVQGIESKDQVSILASTSESIQMKEIDYNTAAASFTEVSPENSDSMDPSQEEFGGILMSKSQSMQMKEFDFTATELFPELSSINFNSTSFENSDSMDYIQEQHNKGILHEPYLLNTSNDLISQSIDYDLSMSKSRSMQMKEFDFTAYASDSFPGLSSMSCKSTYFEKLDSMDSTQEQYERILNEPFLYNTSDDLTTQSIGYDLSISKSQSIQMKDFDFTAADSFPEVSSYGYKCRSMDSFPKDFGEIQYEPFLSNISNDKITQSIGFSSAKIFLSEPFLSDSSNSQYLPYNPALSSVDSVARTFETFGNKPFTLDTYNSHHIPSLESDCSYSTLSFGSSSANHAISSSTTGKMEECTAPFMPLETSDAELLKLLSVVHSFMNSDEDQNNIITLCNFPHWK